MRSYENVMGFAKDARAFPAHLHQDVASAFRHTTQPIFTGNDDASTHRPLGNCLISRQGGSTGFTTSNTMAIARSC